MGRPLDIAPATAVNLNEINDLPTELLTDPIDLYNVSYHLIIKVKSILKSESKQIRKFVDNLTK